MTDLESHLPVCSRRFNAEEVGRHEDCVCLPRVAREGEGLLHSLRLKMEAMRTRESDGTQGSVVRNYERVIEQMRQHVRLWGLQEHSRMLHHYLLHLDESHEGQVPLSGTIHVWLDDAILHVPREAAVAQGRLILDDLVLDMKVT